MPFNSKPIFDASLQQFIESFLVEKVIVIDEKGWSSNLPGCDVRQGRALTSGIVWNDLLKRVRTKYVLVVNDEGEFRLAPEALHRFIEVAESTGAGIVYSDYRESGKVSAKKSVTERIAARTEDHAVNDYQKGSVRDDFDFGPVMLISLSAARKAIKKYGNIADVQYAGLYDLRLKMSADSSFFHIREMLSGRSGSDAAGAPEKEKHFDYVDSQNRAVQKEMEAVFTKHLKDIGAYLEPIFKPVPKGKAAFAVEASVVIPVRNRKMTVADAVRSALVQKTDFPFNIIIVDNHSTDGTTKVLAGLARHHRQVMHVVPKRFDLTIGGCWNEAVFSPFCGRYAVQLDSDDLYSATETLQKMIDMFHRGRYAMVIGAYTLVNEKLEVIPPGLIDHREWTDDNGRNNALRINGLGAPRAFDAAVLRKSGFLNVGYGEDYAAALSLSRRYRVGRIYESLYLCRRWAGNTDARLSVAEKNRHDAFKDSIRTMEILARQKINRSRK